MSADFTPSLDSYKSPGTFRFWCQRVLPLVYDDSLSYYELLCKMADYINKLIEDNKATIDNVEALYQAYNELQEYVNDFFADLDLTGEVERKLDEMVSSGEMEQLIEPVITELTQFLRNESAGQQAYNQETRNRMNEQTSNLTQFCLQTRNIVEAMVGHPFGASSSADMTDTTKIYVYTGTTGGGLTNGHWYYYDGTNWTDGGTYNAVVVEVDASLSRPGVPADAAMAGNDVATLCRLFGSYTQSAFSTASGWRLNPSDGLCTANESYQLKKYHVTEGEMLYVVCDDRFQFQNAESVPSTGTSNKVGYTYGKYNGTITVPEGATYLIISTPVANSIASCSILEWRFNLNSTYVLSNNVFVPGYYIDYRNGNIVEGAGYSYTTINVRAFAGGTIKGTSAALPNQQIGLAFYDRNYNYISGTRPTTEGTYLFEYSLDIPENAYYIRISLRDASSSMWVDPEVTWSPVVANTAVAIERGDTFEIEDKKLNNSYIPELRNGSTGNTGNAKSVTSKYILPLDTQYDYMLIKFIGDTSVANAFGFSYCLFSGATDNLDTTLAYNSALVTKKQINSNLDISQELPYIIVPAEDYQGYDHVAVTVYREMNGVAVPIRIATEQYSVYVEFGYYTSDTHEVDRARKDTLTARHIAGSSAKPLSLAYFSDVHADTAAYNRILREIADMDSVVDGIICTGDMVANAAGEISGWWVDNVMTCIGNHDTASYSQQTGYDWTALSMADRDAYYIAPFESAWGAVHEEGTSYYYKDYTEQNVRLIVMDGMLYNEDTTETANQNAWLTTLLNGAISSGYHVLIAIHAAHGGGTIRQCSFSQLGVGTYPTYTDCNTPQAVIDIVAEKIAGGLKFIGYIVGHEHKDYVVDAEGNGKQLMYSITCAGTRARDWWKNSDMYRSEEFDAFNIITVDTVHTLVKIVRGGGANLNTDMRTRRGICFNYSTGEIVGEIL